jgi:hypothetical protein
MPPDSVMILLSFLSHSEFLQDLLDISRVGRFAEQATAEADRRPHRLERVGVELLRHDADLGPCCAIIGYDIVTVGNDRPFARIDDAADDADQRRLAGAVRPEQGENLALVYLKVDVGERLETRRIGLGQVFDRNDRLHGDEDSSETL